MALSLLSRESQVRTPHDPPRKSSLYGKNHKGFILVKIFSNPISNLFEENRCYSVRLRAPSPSTQDGKSNAIFPIIPAAQ